MKLGGKYPPPATRSELPCQLRRLLKPTPLSSLFRRKVEFTTLSALCQCWSRLKMGRQRTGGATPLRWTLHSQRLSSAAWRSYNGCLPWIKTSRTKTKISSTSIAKLRLRLVVDRRRLFQISPYKGLTAVEMTLLQLRKPLLDPMPLLVINCPTRMEKLAQLPILFRARSGKSKKHNGIGICAMPCAAMMNLTLRAELKAT